MRIKKTKLLFLSIFIILISFTLSKTLKKKNLKLIPNNTLKNQNQNNNKKNSPKGFSFLSTFIKKADNTSTQKAQNNDGTKKTNRLARFLWSMLFVVIFIIPIFFLVRSSTDWAQSSRGEINKLKDQKMREVTEILNKEFSSE